MAHYAHVNSENIVTLVTPLSNDVAEVDGVDDEPKSIAFLESLNIFEGGTWVRSSYNNNIRGHFAQEGDVYDSSLNIFKMPDDIKPFPSWVMNETTGYWEAPVAEIPGYTWNEDAGEWQQPPQPEGFPSFTWQTHWQDGVKRPNGCWSPPVAYPGTWEYVDGDNDGKMRIYTGTTYAWDEASTSWVEEE